MKYVLAIDEGTTGATCLIIGDDGRVAGRGYREIPQHFPQAGWVELDGLGILECVRGAARDAISAAGENPTAIATRRFASFTPAMTDETHDRAMRGWQRAVRAAVSWARDGRESR